MLSNEDNKVLNRYIHESLGLYGEIVSEFVIDEEDKKKELSYPDPKSKNPEALKAAIKLQAEMRDRERVAAGKPVGPAPIEQPPDNSPEQSPPGPVEPPSPDFPTTEPEPVKSAAEVSGDALKDPTTGIPKGVSPEGAKVQEPAYNPTFGERVISKIRQTSVGQKVIGAVEKKLGTTINDINNPSEGFKSRMSRLAREQRADLEGKRQRIVDYKGANKAAIEAGRVAGTEAYGAQRDYVALGKQEQAAKQRAEELTKEGYKIENPNKIVRAIKTVTGGYGRYKKEQNKLAGRGMEIASQAAAKEQEAAAAEANQNNPEAAKQKAGTAQNTDKRKLSMAAQNELRSNRAKVAVQGISQITANVLGMLVNIGNTARR